MSEKIIVIGSMNADLVIHSPQMPNLGETLTGSNFQINAGGKGLNQAVAIAKLGGDVSFLGAVGEDANGELLLNELYNSNVDFKGFKTKEAPTGIAMITVVDGNNFIILDAGANAELTPEVIESYSDLIAECEYCVMQLEIPVETVLKVCEIANESGTKIILNPAPYKELPNEVFSKIDFVIPNEHEAYDLTDVYPDNEENTRKAVLKLKQMGVKNVIITLGERGCAYSVENEIIFKPAIKTNVVDTTSAGDTFIGALVSKLSQNESLENAITFATKASAITVSREGASKSIPYANEIM
ncbi:MAG: ribokinase [Ruminococcaceae bacterium]|nr:ribokinase [Oscillospiraceae bacterium]